MDFILGCNYWASNAGADMWRFFDGDTVKKDLGELSKYGINYIRVFPNWRDFQPIVPLFSGYGVLEDYCLDGDKTPENPYYLDEIMMNRFGEFLDICENFDIKVIVGLITGYMSGRLFVPPALFGKNVITDPTAQYFEQLFIKGFIERFKERKIIYAWDLGNECNSMGAADRINAANWTALIGNAIRAADPSREIISGMHMLGVDRGDREWRITDQALYTDMLTTHPYPYWSEHTSVDDVMSIRATMHATAETKMYGEIGGKPCMTEETGTMGPMICSNENSANFMRLNLFSLWSNDAKGLMWWCAHEQTMLSSYPYTENMVELELGMLDKNHNPKPPILEMHKFGKVLKEMNLSLSEARKDAVCLLTHSQDQWGIGYMTHILMKQAGLNCKFAFADNGIPDSKLYIMPSVNGHHIMNKKIYEELRDRVYRGADLYISMDNGVLAEFESLCGLKPIDSSRHISHGYTVFENTKIEFLRSCNYKTVPTDAKVLAYDNEGYPSVAVNTYGNGRVFYVNFPLEGNMIDEADAFSKGREVIYKKLFSEYTDKLPVVTGARDVAATYHDTIDGTVAVFINHTEKVLELNLVEQNGFTLEKVYYGSEKNINPFDACVLKYKGGSGK